jgi:hypothetical protein
MNSRWNMKIQLKALILTALGCFAAAATAQQYTRAHELAASSITLPEGDTGVLEARTCDTCPVLRVNTTARTIYKIGAVEVRLAEMRLALSQQADTLVLLQATPDNRSVILLQIGAGDAS